MNGNGVKFVRVSIVPVGNVGSDEYVSHLSTESIAREFFETINKKERLNTPDSRNKGKIYFDVLNIIDKKKKL